MGLYLNDEIAMAAAVREGWGAYARLDIPYPYVRVALLSRSERIRIGYLADRTLRLCYQYQFESIVMVTIAEW